MVLNTTSKPFTSFSAMQRLALRGEMIVHDPVTSIEKFEASYRKLTNVKKVIVDKDNFVLANDIINYVSCPVVTLDIEVLVELNKVKFLCYECDEDN